MGEEKIQIVATATDRASGPINTLRTNISRLGSGKTGPLGGMLSGMTGITAASVGAAAGFKLLTDGLQNVGEFIGQGVAGFLNEAESLGRLTTALEANAPAWDGSTMAIDRFVTAQQKMGQSDDDVRDGLTQLVISTGDLEESMRLAALATDVQHGASVSYATAIDIVTKANIGNSRALKQMGIDLGQAATSTELVAALQTRFAGQGELYAESLRGQGAAAAESFEEVQESIGEKAMPAMIGMTNYLTGTLIPGLEHLSDVANDTWNNLFGPRADISGGVNIVDHLLGPLEHAGPAIRDATASFADEIDHSLADSLRNNTDVIDDAMADVAWAIAHPMEQIAQLANLQGAITTLEYKRGLASNTAGINTVIDQQLDVLKGQWALISGRAYDAGYAAQIQYNRGLSNAPRGHIQAPTVPGRFTKDDGHTYGGQAAGGFIGAGEVSWVGERGPELIRAGRQGATVTANHNLGGNQLIHVVTVNELARLLDEGNGRQLALAPSSSYSR